MSKQYLQGKFKPNNPSKYQGNVDDIIYRSSYEYAAFKLCDDHPSIVKWSSEEDVIPYISPKDNRRHRYFMDLKVTVMVKGVPRVTLVEVKPSSETRPPRKGKGRNADATYARKVATWLVNQAKWAAAKEYCARMGWHFTHWTEKELNISGNAELKKVQARKRAATKLRNKKLTSRRR